MPYRKNLCSDPGCFWGVHGGGSNAARVWSAMSNIGVTYINTATGHIHRNRHMHSMFEVPWKEGIYACDIAENNTIEVDDAFVQRVHEDDLPGVLGCISDALAGLNEGQHDITYRVALPSGENLIVRNWGNTYVQEDGTLGVILLTQDMTHITKAQQKEAENAVFKKALEAEIKHKEEVHRLLRTISHEIRNPLQGILTNTQMLLDAVEEAQRTSGAPETSRSRLTSSSSAAREQAPSDVTVDAAATAAQPQRSAAAFGDAPALLQARDVPQGGRSREGEGGHTQRLAAGAPGGGLNGPGVGLPGACVHCGCTCRAAGAPDSVAAAAAAAAVAPHAGPAAADPAAAAAAAQAAAKAAAAEGARTAQTAIGTSAEAVEAAAAQQHRSGAPCHDGDCGSDCRSRSGAGGCEQDACSISSAASGGGGSSSSSGSSGGEACASDDSGSDCADCAASADVGARPGELKLSGKLKFSPAAGAANAALLMPGGRGAGEEHGRLQPAKPPHSDDVAAHGGVLRLSMLRECLEETFECALHQTLVINDLLDYELVRSRNMALKVAPVDVDAVARRVVRMFTGTALRKGVVLECITPPSPLTALGDEQAIKRVLTNLISNAVKFTDEGSISVQVEHRDNGDVVLSVADTGKGIPTEFRDKIFHTIGLTTTNQEFLGGSGLGLCICQTLVTKMGGAISFTDNAPCGTVFRFVVPPQTPAEEPSEGGGGGGRDAVSHGGSRAPSTAESSGGATPASRQLDADLERVLSNKRLLVADDNRIIAKVVSRMLLGLCLELTIVSDGQQALQAYDEHVTRGQPYDLVCLDYHMPKMGGKEAATELRKKDPALPLVFLTGEVASSICDCVNQFAPAALLLKPCPKRDLVAACAKLLQANAPAAAAAAAAPATAAAAATAPPAPAAATMDVRHLMRS